MGPALDRDGSGPVGSRPPILIGHERAPEQRARDAAGQARAGLHLIEAALAETGAQARHAVRTVVSVLGLALRDQSTGGPATIDGTWTERGKPRRALPPGRLAEGDRYRGWSALRRRRPSVVKEPGSTAIFGQT